MSERHAISITTHVQAMRDRVRLAWAVLLGRQFTLRADSFGITVKPTPEGER